MLKQVCQQSLASCGMLLIDKPEGITSFDVIRQLRRVCSVRKMGHTGTLDPFATGLLPILLGKATRLNTWVSGQSKTYEVEMELGRRTDTGDPTGELIETTPVPVLDDAALAALVPQVLAITEQTPPAYSAVKVDGRRAYKLARDGKPVSLTPRPVRIESFDILSFELPRLRYRVGVSKGTYVRALSESIAAMLGTVGVTTALRRSGVGALAVADAVPLDALTPENWQQSLLSPARALGHLPAAHLADDQLTPFSQGRALPALDGVVGTVVVLGEDGLLWGIAEATAERLQPRVVLL
ncbi:MAG: tRNA pseudouridine(55) synthase TruB [Candidatus Cloacimonetes bacterium]|nr:tRNA pseudouridine(55) synthase TruB [Candidatus Cloacimonadota bacterium]